MSGFVEQQRPRCFPLTLIIDCCQPQTEYVPEFLENINLSDIYNIPGESVPMNPEIFSAMRAGSRDFVEKMRNSATPMECLKNDKGDSILHLAAASGNHKLVESIISECPSLLLEPNWKDQIPLHVASFAGRLAVVKTLVASITYFSSKILSEEERVRFNLYLLKDIDGDTPLHAALKRPHLKTALCLVNANKHGSFLENNEGISPLYMAVEAGGLALVKLMLENLVDNVQGQNFNLASKLEGKNWLVHAALRAKNRDILNAVLDKEPSLINERDEEGRTCLSFGASLGYCKGVCNLLDRSTSSVFVCDDDGSFPIHMAVEKGHVDVVKEILKRCPHSIELLNKQGQNILHISAKSGKSRSLLSKYIKKLDRKKSHLIEEQDAEGNTPLHLATINWRPQTVMDLTNVSLSAQKTQNKKNKDGLTPLDIAELKLQPDYVFRERLTLMILLVTYKPNSVSRIPTNGMTLRSRSENQGSSRNKYKDQVNILLLVATLVATVTFAAGIAVPGGFNNSPPDLGRASLAKDRNFILFVLYDSAALYSSLVTIIALIWAQLGDHELVQRAYQLALPSLYMSLLFMSSAFDRALRSTIPHSIASRLLSSLFFILVSILLAPYASQDILGRRLRKCSMRYYLWILLFFVYEDDAQTHHNTFISFWTSYIFLYINYMKSRVI